MTSQPFPRQVPVQTYPQPTQPPIQQSLPFQPPPTPTAPPVQVQPQTLQAAEHADVPPEILALLHDFGKRPGCERYGGDGERIKLLIDYLWLRNLTPTLPFETFLDLYVPLADFDEQNLKHPADAIAALLPRAKKVAEAKGARQWSAREVVDYIAVYVDIIREAERTGVPVPMSLVDFLRNKHLTDQFLAGAFKSATQRAPKQPAEAPEPAGSEPPTAPANKPATKVRTVTSHLPTQDGQRAIMSDVSGRQYRGTCVRVWYEGEGEQRHGYVNFRADSGEEFPGVSIMKFTLCNDPPPKPPVQDSTGVAKPELGRQTLSIPKAEFHNAMVALGLSVPVGTVELGKIIMRWQLQFTDDLLAVIMLVNGQVGNTQSRPYVDACLASVKQDGEVVAELHPRDNLEGTYPFEVGEGIYTLEVRGNK